MSDQPDNLVLLYLRRLDERTGRMEEDMRDLKGRATLLEQRVAAGFTHLEGTIAHQTARLDRLENRLERVERRLDLLPPAAE